jgi:phage terminase large subunit-like protein
MLTTSDLSWLDWWVDHPRHNEDLSCRSILLWRQRIKMLCRHDLYYFDEEKPRDVIRFIEAYLRHNQAPFTNQPVVLCDYQKYDIIYPVFGLRKKCDNKRLIRELYLSMAKKNGKSFLISALVCYLIFKEDAGNEAVCAATTLRQSELIYDATLKFIEKNPKLSHSSFFSSRKAPFKEMTIKKKGGSNTFFPCTSNLDALDGRNVTWGVLDELHRHKSPDFYNLIHASVGTRPEPLVISTTTAGNTINGICYQVYQKCITALEKSDEDNIIEPTLAPVIYEADDIEDSSFDEEKEVRKANPGYGVNVTADFIQSELEKVRSNPANKHSFIRYHLNRFHMGGASKALDYDQWKKGSLPKSKVEQILADTSLEWVIAIDLSLKVDLTAVCLLCRFDNNMFFYYNKYFTYGDDQVLAQRSKTERLPFMLWKEEGQLVNTPGGVINFETVDNYIIELENKYSPKKIVFDPAMALSLASRYDGNPKAHAFKGGYANWNFPFTEMIRTCSEGRLHHSGGSLEGFNASSLMLKHNQDGLIRPVKQFIQSSDKIDGMVSLIMGFSAFADLDFKDSKDKPKKLSGEQWKRIANVMRT